MEKKSLMPSSLVILAIFLCLQVCCCVRPRTDGLDMEAPAFQNCNFIVLEVKVKTLKVKLRECKAEIQVLKDNLKKLRGKPLSLESRQYADSSSCNETAMDGRPLVDGASLKSQSKDDKKKSVSAHKPDVSVRSLALSAEADGGRISGNQEDNSFASFSSFESSAENEREIPTSRGTENYDGLPLERVRTDGKVDTHVPFISDPSSILSNPSTNSSDSLVSNIAEGVQMPCLREGSSDSCEETEPTEMLQATGSGFSNGIAPGNTSLNTGSFNRGIPQEAHFSDSEDVTYGGGNSETVVDDMQGTSIESCNQVSSSSCWSGPRASLGLAESNNYYGSSFSSNSAFHSLLTGHKGLIIGDGNQTSLQHNSIERDKRTIGNGECDPECSSKAGNQLQLLQQNSKGDNQQKEERQEPFSGSSPKTENQPVPQQNSSDSDQVPEESCEPDAVSSSERNWEHQCTQMQHPLDLPLWQSSSPVSGLVPDILARHSQDRSILQSLYTDDRGLINVSEAISVRQYFGEIGASSCERLGGAFSDVSSGGCTARAGFSGSSFHNESSCSSSTHNTAEPLQSFTGQPHFPWVRNGVLSDGVNTRNCLLPQNDFANRNHSLTGEQDFSRECESLLNQNFLIGRLISPNSRFVYGSTSSNFSAGIVPRYLIYGMHSRVLSNGNLALIADQRSRHSNLNLESQSIQFGERAEASFAANGVVLGMLAFIVPSL